VSHKSLPLRLATNLEERREAYRQITPLHFWCLSIPGKGLDFFPRHLVQTGSGAHPDSYQMGTEGWPFTSI